MWIKWHININFDRVKSIFDGYFEISIKKSTAPQLVVCDSYIRNVNMENDIQSHSFKCKLYACYGLHFQYVVNAIDKKIKQHGIVSYLSSLFNSY